MEKYDREIFKFQYYRIMYFGRITLFMRNFPYEIRLG